MPKGEVRRSRQSKADAASTRPVASTGERRVPAPVDPASARVKRPESTAPDVAGTPRSTAMRLAAEVERLERELNAARAQMAVLEARADVDPLTEVLNRRGFERELKRSLAYASRYQSSAALLYLDLDGFKSINDQYGHAAGDAVLRAAAMVIGRHVRASDVVARLGGDEFAVLLWNIDGADARRKALAIEAAIARTTATHNGTTLSVGASVGTAPLLPLDKPADVLERGDRAMYTRKAARKAARKAGTDAR